MYGDGSLSTECDRCGRRKYWYNYPLGKKGEVIGSTCLNCIERGKRLGVISKIITVMAKAEKNGMADLRKHLFECLQQVKDKQLDLESAKSACLIAQTIINSAKLELDFIKAVGGVVKKSEFFQIEDKSSANE